MLVSSNVILFTLRQYITVCIWYRCHWIELILHYKDALDHSILLKARHDELIHESITLQNYEFTPRLMAIMRSWLKNDIGILSPNGIWTTVPWNRKPVCYRWAKMTPSRWKHSSFLKWFPITCSLAWFNSFVRVANSCKNKEKEVLGNLSNFQFYFMAES